MRLVEEGLLAMRGCWRLLWRDPAAFEDFNLTIDGFWRSFAMVVPVLVLAYPVLLSAQQSAVETAATAGENPPDVRLGVGYVYLLASVALWPLVAAVLARLLGVAQNYVRYMIIYNWMSVPMMALLAILHLLHLAPGAWVYTVLTHAVLFFSLYVSWYVARAGLATTIPIAFAFLFAEYALTSGLGLLIR